MITRAWFVILALAALASSAHAAQVGQNILSSDYVTLEVIGSNVGGCGGTDMDFVRNLPDGSRDTVNVSSTGAFRIPKGHVLVVTDVDWQYVHPDGAAAAGTIEILRLFIENLSTAESNRAFESTVTLSSVGEGGASVAASSGFIVSSKARICPDVVPGPAGPPSGLQHLIVRGYLAK